MVTHNSPVFIACRPTGIIAILLAFCIALLLSGNASAANLALNGDFETGDFTDWGNVGYSITDTSHSGDWAVRSYHSMSSESGSFNDYISQDIDFTHVDNLTFYYYSTIDYNYTGGYTSSHIYCDIDADASYEWSVFKQSISNYAYVDVDVSLYSGVHTVHFGNKASYSNVILTLGSYFDDITAVADVDSVEWNQSSYSVGDTGSMAYSITGYDSGTYDYSVDIFEGSTFMGYCHLNSSDGNVLYTFSGVVEPVTYYAKLTKRVKGSSIPLVLTTDTCSVGPSDVSIVFNQSIYGPDDLVSISYYNCPNSSKIILQDDIIPHQVSNTWVDISGNGSVSYQLSNADANRIFYAKVYSVSDIVLASDYMQIDDISSGFCQVHGGIYDSQDYHPLIGTVFIGGSYSDVVEYSDYGAYSIIVPWGTYNISAVVSSYLTHNISNVAISGSSYDLNMFLSVNDTTTHVFRGSVTDADTNAAVDNVLIQVCNDTFDEYDFTSQSGVWVVNGLTSGANYTLHATKDEYHSYTYSFTYDPGDFYHNFMMSPVSVDEDDDTEDDLEDDVLDDDETMTEYYNEKFRDFAPTIWGFFMLMCLLFLMSILTSFNSGGKRR